MKKDYYRLARYTLIISTIGFLLSYPFRVNPFFGFIASVFSASTVGGIADWFAVTALFRRPLGIPSGKIIRTEIITVNRERFTNDLANMVRDELLTRENLKKELNNICISDILINYLEHGGSKNVKSVFNRLLQDIFTIVDPQAVGGLVEEAVKSNAAKIRITSLIVEAVDYTAQQGYDEKIVDFILDELNRLVNRQQVRLMFIRIIKETKVAYEKGMKRREFINQLLDISPIELAAKGQETVAKLLAEVKNDVNHTGRIYLKERIRATLEGLRDDPSLQQKLEDWKREQIEHKLDIRQQIASFYQKVKENQVSNIGEVLGLRRLLGDQIDQVIGEFKENHQQQQYLDESVKGLLVQMVDEKHSQISSLVKESLSRLDDRELVANLEERTGNDLQIIRVSGAVVGGAMGGILFFINRLLS